MATTNTQWPQASGKNYSNITDQGNPRGHYGDQNQYTYNYKPTIFQIICNKDHNDWAHDPASIQVSTIAQVAQSSGAAKKQSQSKQVQPESEPDTESEDGSDEESDGGTANPPQRAQLTLPVPLSKKDEILLIARLEREGYEETVRQNVIKKIKASPANNAAASAQQGSEKSNAQRQTRPVQTSTSAGAVALPSRPAAGNSAESARPIDVAAQFGQSGPTIARSAPTSDRLVNLHRLVQQCRVNPHWLSREEMARLAQWPPEQQQRRLLEILYRRDRKTYDAVVKALGQRENSSVNFWRYG